MQSNNVIRQERWCIAQLGLLGEKWTKTVHCGAEGRKGGEEPRPAAEGPILHTAPSREPKHTGCTLTGRHGHRRWAGRRDKRKEDTVTRRCLLISREETGNRSKQTERGPCIPRITRRQDSTRHKDIYKARR